MFVSERSCHHDELWTQRVVRTKMQCKALLQQRRAYRIRPDWHKMKNFGRLLSRQSFGLLSRRSESQRSFVGEASEGRVRIISLQRPEKRNAVHHVVALQLFEAFQRAERDPAKSGFEDVSSVVLRGEGADFCGGYDLAEAAGAGPELLGAFRRDWDAFRPMGPTRTAWTKPVVVALQGHAVAGGLELALMGDSRVGCPSAVFGVFCRRFGVPLIDGGTVRLAPLVGLGRALDMVLTGRAVGAEEAFEWGLLDEVVEEGRVLEAAVERASAMGGSGGKARLSLDPLRKPFHHS